MVAEAIEAQERSFQAQHGEAADEQLLDYLRQQAEMLGHSPWPREIAGGRLIEQRFGSWQAALLRAGLPMPVTADKLTGFAWFQEETERQKEAYRRKKAEKKQRAQERARSRKEKQKQGQQELPDDEVVMQ